MEFVQNLMKEVNIQGREVESYKKEFEMIIEKINKPNIKEIQVNSGQDFITSFFTDTPIEEEQIDDEELILRYKAYLEIMSIQITNQSDFISHATIRYDEMHKSIQTVNTILINLKDKGCKEVIKSHDNNECIICMMSEKEYAFVPCGHYITCETCKETVTNCPICNVLITHKVKIFNP